MRKLLATTILAALSVSPVFAADKACPHYLNHDVRKLHSSEHLNVCDAFAGKPLLIVNTASRCGFTPQFAGLEALHQRYKDKGLIVLGVPSNDFRQAAPDEAAAARVCFINYGVTFTMLSQQRVRGPQAHPIFRELSRQAGEPSWNFSKYLIARDGTVVRRFESTDAPMSEKLRQALEALL